MFAGRRPCSIDELCSERSGSSSTSDATTARWYEAFETREAASQSTRRSEWSSPSETKPRPRRSRHSGVDPTHGREIHRCPRSECRSVTVSPRTQRDVRDAEGRVFWPQARAGPKWNDSAISMPTSTSVPPVHSAFLNGRLVQLHLQSRAQETSRAGGLPRVRNGRMTQC